MNYILSTGIVYFLKGKRIKTTRTLLRILLELEDCENQVYYHMTHPTFQGYNPVEACNRVIGKPFQHHIKFCSSQLSLPSKFYITSSPTP